MEPVCKIINPDQSTTKLESKTKSDIKSDKDDAMNNNKDEQDDQIVNNNDDDEEEEEEEIVKVNANRLSAKSRNTIDAQYSDVMPTEYDKQCNKGLFPLPLYSSL